LIVHFLLQYIWVSSAESQSNFEISEDPRGNTLGRGTLVSLHLKEDAKQYLEQDRLKVLCASLKIQRFH
jgi:heat shock protein beta